MQGDISEHMIKDTLNYMVLTSGHTIFFRSCICLKAKFYLLFVNFMLRFYFQLNSSVLKLKTTQNR